MVRFALLLAGVALASIAGATPAVPAGDPDKGEAIYARCAACHSLAYDRTGPRHCGLFGRRAGSVKGFTYSQGMERSGIIWTRETLDRFLADPMKYVPGTSMGYAGIPDRQERADLIAYLQRANGTPECRH